MDLKLFIHVLVVFATVSNCSGFDAPGRGRGDPSFAVSTKATTGDMLNVLGDVAVGGPYSRYLYSVRGADGNEEVSGIISTAQGDDENMRLVVIGKELKVIPKISSLEFCGTGGRSPERVSFNGGYACDNRLAVVPGLYTPVELHPDWFPSNVEVSVDEKGNFLVRIKRGYTNETQGLVVFMDAHGKLGGTKCNILGTFHTIPQLKKLINVLRSEGKYNGEHYILRLSWSSTFALVTITRDGRER